MMISARLLLSFSHFLDRATVVFISKCGVLAVCVMVGFQLSYPNGSKMGRLYQKPFPKESA